MSYSTRLKKLRLAAGLTQKEVCEKTGIKLGTYRAWEQGVSQLRLDDVVLLAEAFGTDPNTVAGWYDNHPSDKSDLPAMTPDESALLSHYRASSPPDRQNISRVAEALSDEEGAEG